MRVTQHSGGERELRARRDEVGATLLHGRQSTVERWHVTLIQVIVDERLNVACPAKGVGDVLWRPLSDGVA